MKNRKSIIIISVVLAFIALAIFMKFRQPNVAQVLPTVKVERRNLANNITVLGTVETASKQEVFPELTGMVKYAIDEGAEVKKGDIILELDANDLSYESKQIQSKLAQQEVELARLLRGPREEELEKAKLKLSDAIDARSKAEENYEKYRKLFEQGAVSQQELASFESELEKADGQLALAQLDLEMIENPDKTEIEIKQLLLQETRASLARVHEKIQKSIIRAQRDGIVLQNAVKPGMVVTPGSAVMVIGDPLDLEIVFEVNEYDFPKLAIGQRAMITGEAFYGYTYEGEVVKIAPTAIQTQTNRGSETRVSATLKILNPDEKIRPGFSATVDIIAEERGGALTLPLESVIEDHKVFVMEDGDPMEKVIKTGIRNELFVEILEGLIEGEEVLRYPPQDPQKVIP